MVDTIPALVWCTLPDGSNEFHNQRWHDYTGLSEGAEHGWGWRVAYHPEDLEQLLDKFQSIVASGEPGEFEARLRRFDGEYRWFLIRAVPLRDETGKIVYWYGSSTDIEDRKRAEEKLRQDERELRRITDAIAQTIVVQSRGRCSDLREPGSARLYRPDHRRCDQPRISVPGSFIRKISSGCARIAKPPFHAAFRSKSNNER